MIYRVIARTCCGQFDLRDARTKARRSLAGGALCIVAYPTYGARHLRATLPHVTLAGELHRGRRRASGELLTTLGGCSSIGRGPLYCGEEQAREQRASTHCLVCSYDALAKARAELMPEKGMRWGRPSAVGRRRRGCARRWERGVTPNAGWGWSSVKGAAE